MSRDGLLLHGVEKAQILETEGKGLNPTSIVYQMCYLGQILPSVSSSVEWVISQ